MRRSILVKGLILIAVPLLFQLIFLGVIVKIRYEGASAQSWTIHTKDVIAQAQRCRVLILSTHGSIQGYVITRDPSFEVELDLSASSVKLELVALRDLVSDNPDQTRSMAIIQAASLEFLSYIEEGKSLVEQKAMDGETARTRRQKSRELLSNLEQRFDLFLQEERRLDRVRQERLERSWATLDRFLIGGGIASIFCSVMMAVLFSRNISGRIAGLTENTRRLAAGKVLVPMVQGEDEISRLDQVFHEMATTLDDAARRERVHAEQIAQRAEELAELNAQLREKAAENEMFVYSVSHDLRSPLVNLQGFSKELSLIGSDLTRLIDQEGVPGELRRQGRLMVEKDMGESIGFIQTGVSRLSGIIDALLRLSRAGRIEYRFQPVNLDLIVRRVVSSLRGTIEQKQAEVLVGKLPSVLADPTAVEQVFANLIGNAINYLDPKRQGRIVIESVGDPATTESTAPVNFLVVAIRDNGLGIAELHKSKVFSAFQRLHGDIAPGEGIGLTLVRRMVDRHGGRIWFESEAGRGTTFYVALPPTEAVSMAIDPVEPSLATTGSLALTGRNA